MTNHMVTKSVGRVALLTSKPILALVVALFIADMLGSMGWVQGRVEGDALFHLFGSPISAWAMGMTLLIWMITTGIQMISSGMAYRAETNPYMAGVGIYFWLVTSIMKKTTANYTEPSYMAVFTTEYGKMAQEWQGLAILVALYWPSQLFDMLTDAVFFGTTPLKSFNFFFACSSLVSEQLAYLASVAKDMGDEVREELNAYS